MTKRKEEPVLVPLTNGMFATVDRRDYDRVASYKWAIYSDTKKRLCVRQQLPYQAERRNQGQYGKYLHRFILELEEAWKTVRFRNGDKLDCRRQNMYVICYQSLANNPKPRGATARPDLEKFPDRLPSPCGGIVAILKNQRCRTFYEQFGGCRHYDKCLDACCRNYWPGFIAAKDLQ